MKIICKIFALSCLFLSWGCDCARDFPRVEKHAFSSKDLRDIVVYESTYDFESDEAKKALNLADLYKLQGSVSVVSRHPTESELELVKWAIDVVGEEMDDNEGGKLYFLKTSPGITVKLPGGEEFQMTGRSIGYRIIYGPNEKLNKDPGKKFDFHEVLTTAVPACLVAEQIVGLGNGFVSVGCTDYSRLMGLMLFQWAVESATKAVLLELKLGIEHVLMCYSL
jgi:hypothetical protein